MLGDLDNATVGFAWQFALVANTKRQLAKSWTASATVATNDAMILAADGIVYALVASVGGTTGATAPTPTVGSITDNSVTWIGYKLSGARYLTIVNTDAATLATAGDVSLQLVPVPPSNGSAGPFPTIPTAIYAISTGTPILAVVVSA